jgi:hypothetical protein
MNAVAEPSAQSEVVGVGLGDAEVIEKYAGLDAILCERARTAQQKSYNDGREPDQGGVNLLKYIAGSRSVSPCDAEPTAAPNI